MSVNKLLRDVDINKTYLIGIGKVDYYFVEVFVSETYFNLIFVKIFYKFDNVFFYLYLYVY